MSDAYTVPGVYVTESNGVSLSIQSGETAVPVFVGIFNARAPRERKAPLTCVRIESWLEFTHLYGPSDRINVDIPEGKPPAKEAPEREDSNASADPVKVDKVDATSYMGSHSVRLYFENGGGPCYILSVNEREDLDSKQITATTTAITAAIAQCPDITLLCWCEFIPDYPELDQSIYTALGGLLADHAGRFLLTDGWAEGEAGNPGAWTFASPQVTSQDQVAAYFPALLSDYVPDYADYADHGVRVTINDTTLIATLAKNSVKNVDGNAVISKDKSAKVTLSALQEKKAFSDIQLIIDAIQKAVTDKIPAMLDAADPMILRASVAMAGVYARVDRERGVWKAPANVGLAGVTGLMAAGKSPDKLQNKEVGKTWDSPVPIRIDDALNANLVTARVNALRELSSQGVMVWGARTQVEPSAVAWRYVPVRRLFNTVERDAKTALQAAVFEPNSPVTWESVRGALENYLHALWRQGALQGEAPTQAYFVEVGLGTTMTQDDIQNGKLIVKVGLAAVRPAEFIILELTQDVVPA